MGATARVVERWGAGSGSVTDCGTTSSLPLGGAGEDWVRLVLSFQGVLIREYPLDRSVLTIGRHADNDIVIDHLGVSGKHARVGVDGQSVVLTDLKSTNGTFVNGRRVEQSEIRPNDWITIGKHILTLKTSSR